MPSDHSSWCAALSRMVPGRGDGVRTHDPQLGKLMLYQLSYARVGPILAGGVCGESGSHSQRRDPALAQSAIAGGESLRLGSEIETRTERAAGEGCSNCSNSRAIRGAETPRGGRNVTSSANCWAKAGRCRATARIASSASTDRRRTPSNPERSTQATQATRDVPMSKRSDEAERAASTVERRKRGLWRKR